MCHLLQLLLLLVIIQSCFEWMTYASVSRDKAEADVETSIDDESDEPDILSPSLITEQDDSQSNADDLADEKSVTEAIKDVAYYLRSHKFNDFDRRFYQAENETIKVLYTHLNSSLNTVEKT